MWPNQYQTWKEKEIKHVRMCCNMFWSDSLPIGDMITRRKRNVHINKIKPYFLSIADPSIPIKKKRKILAKKQVGSGIMSVLTNALLPALISLLFHT